MSPTSLTNPLSIAPPAEPVAGAASSLPAVPAAPAHSMTDVFHGYLSVFIVAFVVTLFATPLMRRLAVSHGIIDHPTEARKVHRIPVAYLGGVAVYIGLMAAVAFSYLAPELSVHLPFNLLEAHRSTFELAPIPFSILLGMTVIMLTGLIDDVVGLSPRIKIGGQLLAAAALAMQDVGTKVASGILTPIGNLVGNQSLVYHIPLPFDLPIHLGPPSLGPNIEIDIIYWTGVAIIAFFVLGACNASNLIDGLDGLLSGVTSIAAVGLLVLALVLATIDDGRLDGARLVLAMALLGACLGFLPHNFNPATIFLGDAGSLLLGYTTIVLVLTLGDTGKTHLVVAGLIIYAIPIIDTVLAMVRRKMAGRPLWAPDDQHLHHLLKRQLGVKGAVFTLYGIGLTFAALGIWLSFGRVRIVFTIAMVIAAFIGVAAVKVARRQIIEGQAAKAGARPFKSGRPSAAPDDAPLPGPPAPPAPPAPPTPPARPADNPRRPTPV